MAKISRAPDTTLYPVPIVLITTGGLYPNVMTCNRIMSCSAEPPRLAISIRPGRYSHRLLMDTREFVVNIPYPGQSLLTDYVGVVTGIDEDKIQIADLDLAPSATLETPLLADCPVNIECRVEETLMLDSHTMFIGRVERVHLEEAVLDEHGDVILAVAEGLVYDCGTVREKPTYKFKVAELRTQVQKPTAPGSAES